MGSCVGTGCARGRVSPRSYDVGDTRRWEEGEELQEEEEKQRQAEVQPERFEPFDPLLWEREPLSSGRRRRQRSVELLPRDNQAVASMVRLWNKEHWKQGTGSMLVGAVDLLSASKVGTGAEDGVTDLTAATLMAVADAGGSRSPACSQGSSMRVVEWLQEQELVQGECGAGKAREAGGMDLLGALRALRPQAYSDSSSASGNTA